MPVEFTEFTAQDEREVKPKPAKSTVASAATPAAGEPRLSLGQIATLEDEYRSAKERLETLKERRAKRQGKVDELMDKQARAMRLRSLTNGLSGFDGERELATVALQDVAAELPMATQQLKAVEDQIATEQAILARIDTSLFKRVEEIKTLAAGLHR